MPNPAKRDTLCNYPKTVVLVFREYSTFWEPGPPHGGDLQRRSDLGGVQVSHGRDTLPHHFSDIMDTISGDPAAYSGVNKKNPGNIAVLLFLVILPCRECLVDLFPHVKIRELGVYDRVDLCDIRFPVRQT